jgi:predicted transposase YbfD/YdcC
MQKKITKSVDYYFEQIQDPRHHNTVHRLIDIIILSISAVVAGADTYEQIENFGKKRKKWLQKFLELPAGIPSHDTIGRVFERIDPDEFQNSFKLWIEAITEITSGQVIAIDGKTLRRSHDRSKDKKAIHMISAWAASNKVVLGQLKTAEKSNEITAIPRLLKLLDITGCIITIDAMGTQKKIAKTIIDKGGDYVLAVKENHKSLYTDITAFFEDTSCHDSDAYKLNQHETTDGDHGRIEIRKYATTSDILWLQGKENWSGIKSIGVVLSTREINGKISSEKRYYISSLDSDAKKFGHAVRSHWGIENAVHWVLDIAFREDESRIRKGYAPENFAVLRHIALNLIRNNKSFKGSIKSKRFNAALDIEYLEEIMFA